MVIVAQRQCDLGKPVTNAVLHNAAVLDAVPVFPRRNFGLTQELTQRAYGPHSAAPSGSNLLNAANALGDFLIGEHLNVRRARHHTQRLDKIGGVILWA